MKISNYKFQICLAFTLWIVALITSPKPIFAEAPYPIPALGNCRDQKECRLYCDVPANTPACWSYDKYVLNPNVLGESTVDPEEEARAHGITFPISELGNCANPSECFIYCNQPQNQDTCFNFAKNKGLIKEEKPPGINPQEIMAAAKNELGCTSEFSCMTFCQTPSNFEKCQSFARNHKLIDPEEERRGPPPEVLEKAKRELGCDNQTSCMDVCSNPDNLERCMQFAKKNRMMDEEEIEHQEEFIKKKMEMMEDAKTELGCETPSSCMNFCQRPENTDVCMNLAKKHNFGPPPQQMMQGPQMQTGQPQQFQQSGQFGGSMTPPTQMNPQINQDSGRFGQGPGGCANEKECKEYCQKHPNDCPGFNQQQFPNTPSQSFQQSNQPPIPVGSSANLGQSFKPPQQESSKMGDFLGPAGCKTEKECKAYCEKHPNECPGFPKDKPNSSSFPQPDKSGQQNRPTPFSGSGGQPPNQPPPPNQPSQGGPQNMMNKEQEKYMKEQMKNEQKPPENKSGEYQPPPNPPPQVAI